jgi:cytoskeletal protein CcmA (bactofilin family)
MGSHHTLISKGTRIIGEVHFTGELNVEGQLVGNIIADANSELLISQSGQIEGQIQAPKIIVRGLIQGDIHCTKHLELGATAVVNGNVFYTVLEMVKGAQVNGNLIYVKESEGKKKTVGAA